MSQAKRSSSDSRRDREGFELETRRLSLDATGRDAADGGDVEAVPSGTASNPVS